MDRATLECQISSATILKRENTGAGFYTYCAVDRTSNAPVEGLNLRHGPMAKIDGLDHGMGFILWLKDGYLDCLEGYSYEENTTAVVLEHAVFDMVDDPVKRSDRPK